MSKPMDFINGTAAFIIPHYSTDIEKSKRDLDEAIKGIFNQTDESWRIVIIDDSSPSQQAKDYLRSIEREYPDKIKLIFKDTNDGPGACRNAGIEWACRHHSPLVLFNDADDISHPRRLEISRKIFVDDPEAGVVYSTFKVIDENGCIVPKGKITPSILEILEAHEHHPPQGKNVWIAIGTETGYINLTSATAVKTELAYKYPFPAERASEDSHTWMRYSASGEKFFYVPEIPTLYRIPQNTEGSASRSREGGKHEFYAKGVRVKTEGFTEALRIALENNSIRAQQADDLLIKFYIKAGESLLREDEEDLALQQVMKAMGISKEIAGDYCAQKGEKLKNIFERVQSTLAGSPC